MNIETINQPINMTKLVGSEKKTKVIEGDVNVPDIKPDILSLTCVENEVFITKQEILDGKVNVEGTMEVCIIYMSEDENGSFKNLTGSFNFTESFNMNGINENSIVDLRVFKGPIECKVVNARKVNIKSPVTLDIRVMNTSECNIAKDVVNEKNLELQKKSINLNVLQNCKMQDIDIQENISLDEGSKPIGELLKCSLKITNEDYKISYNKIFAKADAAVKIIYVADDETQSIESFETSIPVMGFVDYEGINDNKEVTLDYCVRSYCIKPLYQDLKSLSFSVDGKIGVRVCVYQKESTEIIDDIYCPDCNLKCEYEDVRLLQNIINQTDNVEINQGLLIPELDNIKILNINAQPNINTKNVLDGKIALEGNVNFDILNYNENKKVLEDKKMELPFAQVVKVPNLQSGVNVDVEMNIRNIEFAKVDPSQIQMKLDANVVTHVNKEENLNGIKSIESSDDALPEMPSIVIYYVKAGDTLWNIAKKYRTTVKEIMTYNELKDDKIYPNQQLIIPKRNNKMTAPLL